MLAAHTCHVALGTHHPSQQLMPDLYCQGKAGAASGTCVWKALSWTVSDKLGELHVMLHVAEVTEVASVTGDQAAWLRSRPCLGGSVCFIFLGLTFLTCKTKNLH